MNLVQEVIDLVREASELRKKLKVIANQMESLVGSKVTYCVQAGKKRKFYRCTVDAWNGEGWDIFTDDPDDPEYFVATFDDFVEGRIWISDN
jgi:hypothetical protein